MSHHRKRVYPAQVGYMQEPIQQTAGTIIPEAADAYQIDANGIPLQQQSQQMPPQGFNGMNNQAMFTPAQQQLGQQIDQAAAGLNSMQLHNVPVIDPNAYLYQPSGATMPAVQQQQQQQGFDQANYGQQYQMPGKQAKRMNQLYPVDLFTQLPPPIRDLSLPPPPLLVPPEKMLVPSDASNASPDYIRCTLNAVPKSNNLLKKSKLPLALVIRPYQHLHDTIDPPPLNDDGLVVRCRRCRSYINPFVSFTDQGRKWRCNFCRLANDVPSQFDQSAGGPAVNRYDRNELKYATMEYLAPKEYTMRQPPPSIYTFILDVSANANKNGLLATTCRILLESLDSIPNHDNRTRISLLCVDNCIHHFTIPSDDDEESSVQMMDISDIEEPFLPRPNLMVQPLSMCRKNLEKLLNTIPELFQHDVTEKFALGSALRAAKKMIGGIGGKVIVVSSTLPNHGIGKLKKRVETGIVNTSKETSQLLSCQDSFYKSFTIECSKTQITIDMFLATEEYIDVATLANLGRFTGGQTHFYPGFSAANMADVTKFAKEFSKHLSMDITMETVMRARGSTGLRMNSFYGHFFNRSSDLCAFSTMPRDQGYVFEMNIDEPISAEYCYVQVAVLLSLNTGERRIRIITVGIPTTESLLEVYASADQLSIVSFLTQKAVDKALNSSIDSAREYLSRSMQDILAVYKKDMVVSNTAGGAPLRLCANLRMLPLLIHALGKHMGFRAGIVPSDHRAIALNNLESMPQKYLIKNIYATVYSLHNMVDEAGLPDENGNIVLPQQINASATLFERYGLYLIDNGSELFLWVGGEAVPNLVNDVFGMEEILQVPIGKQELPILRGSEFNERVRNIIAAVREHDDTVVYQTLYVVRGPSPNEPVQHPSGREVATLRLWATSCLVEDKVMNSESYREFLQGMKAKISK